jgi:signal transduction histidine kinase
VLTDLKRRIDGGFSIESINETRIVLVNTRCPFGTYVEDRESLCMMTSNVSGRIAAHNLGYTPIELIVDRNGFVQRWNRQAERKPGLDACYATGESRSLESLFECRSHPLMVDVCTAVTGSFLTVRAKQTRDTGKSTRWSLDVSRMVVDGQPYYLLAGRDDIPVLQRFKLLNGKLKAANKEAAGERLLLKALALKNDELSKFSTATAHDLKTPLTQIKMLLQFVLEDYQNSLPSEASELLGKASTSVDNLNKVISEMLSQARSDALKSHRLVIDLDDACKAHSQQHRYGHAGHWRTADTGCTIGS